MAIGPDNTRACIGLSPPINVPPLRERRDDIPLMVRYFAR